MIRHYYHRYQRIHSRKPFVVADEAGFMLLLLVGLLLVGVALQMARGGI